MNPTPTGEGSAAPMMSNTPPRCSVSLDPQANEPEVVHADWDLIGNRLELGVEESGSDFDVTGVQALARRATPR